MGRNGLRPDAKRTRKRYSVVPRVASLVPRSGVECSVPTLLRRAGSPRVAWRRPPATTRSVGTSHSTQERGTSVGTLAPPHRIRPQAVAPQAPRLKPFFHPGKAIRRPDYRFLTFRTCGPPLGAAQNLAFAGFGRYDWGCKELRMRAHSRSSRAVRSRRRGAAILDYALAMGVAASLAGLTLYQSGRIIRVVYQFTCAFISWPFM